MSGCRLDEEGVVGGNKTRVIGSEFLPQFLSTSGLVIRRVRFGRHRTLVRRNLASFGVQLLSGIGSSYACRAYFAADS